MIPNINLLPNIGKRRSGFKLSYLIIVFLITVGICVMLWQLLTTNTKITQMQNQRMQLQEARAQLQGELRSKTDKQSGGLMQSFTFVENIAYPVTPLMDEVSSLLPQRAYLRDYMFGTNIVSINVDVISLSAASTYITALESSKYFTAVKPEIVSRFTLSENMVSTDEAAQRTSIESQRFSVKIDLTINEFYLAAGRLR